jgi:hypothetical protein
VTAAPATVVDLDERSFAFAAGVGHQAPRAFWRRSS